LIFEKDCTVPGCREKHILPAAICRLCRDEFQTEELLEEHWGTEHQDKNSKISCPICDKELSNNFQDCKYHTC
jgi:rubrerythrin